MSQPDRPKLSEQLNTAGYFASLASGVLLALVLVFIGSKIFLVGIIGEHLTRALED